MLTIGADSSIRTRKTSGQPDPLALRAIHETASKEHSNCLVYMREERPGDKADSDNTVLDGLINAKGGQDAETQEMQITGLTHKSERNPTKRDNRKPINS